MSMSITLHNLEDAAITWIEEEAARCDVTVETVVISLIYKEIYTQQHPLHMTTYHDLDSLAGTWNDKDADEFLKQIAYFNQVDDTLWQ